MAEAPHPETTHPREPILKETNYLLSALHPNAKTFTETQTSQVQEIFKRSFVSSADVATLLLAREAAHLTHDPELKQKLQDEVSIVQSKTLFMLAYKIPNEYALAGRADVKLNNYKEEKAYAFKPFTPFFENCLTPEKPLHPLTADQRKLLLDGLTDVQQHYRHNAWNPILEKTIGCLQASPKDFDDAFEYLLMEAHANGIVGMSILGNRQGSDSERCAALLTVHHSGRYGVEKLWGALPTRIQEMLKQDARTLFDLKPDHSTRDITLVASSIMKMDNFEQKYQLSRAVYNFESDPQDKELFRQTLLAEGVYLLCVPTIDAKLKYKAHIAKTTINPSS